MGVKTLRVGQRKRGAPQRARAMAPACLAEARAYTLEAVTDGYLSAYDAGRQASLTDLGQSWL